MLINHGLFYIVMGLPLKSSYREDPHPLMGVGATPRRVAPGQGGFRDFM